MNPNPCLRDSLVGSSGYFGRQLHRAQREVGRSTRKGNVVKDVLESELTQGQLGL